MAVLQLGHVGPYDSVLTILAYVLISTLRHLGYRDWCFTLSFVLFPSSVIVLEVLVLISLPHYCVLDLSLSHAIVLPIRYDKWRTCISRPSLVVCTLASALTQIDYLFSVGVTIPIWIVTSNSARALSILYALIRPDVIW